MKEASVWMNEAVWFSWIVYRSRGERARILKRVMADERLKGDTKNMPFDARRTIYGGFKVMVDL